MIKKLTYSFVFILVLFSCQKVNRAEEPEKLIPQDKMVDILEDLIKIDAAESKNRIDFNRRDIKPSELILKKYNIDSLQFAENLTYYAEDFDKNEAIYQEVRTRLEAEKELLDSLVKKEREENRKKDKTDPVNLRKELEKKEAKKDSIKKSKFPTIAREKK